MSGYPAEDRYKAMIGTFRINDLQALLGAFNRNKYGQKSELKGRALELLRSTPVDINYHAYLAKIEEIYHSPSMNNSLNNDMLHMMQSRRQQQQIMSNNIPQLRTHQTAPTNYPQSMHISQAGLPQIMPQIESNIYANNIFRNNIEYNIHPAGSRNIIPHIPTNQQVNAVSHNHLKYDMHPSTHSLAKFRLKKLPFYEVVSDVIKPTTMVGQKKCSLPNSPKDMTQLTFKINMLPEQVNYISLHRNITKNEYLYQLQIRICLLDLTSTELNDFLPLALHIRINNKVCQLPPTPPNTRPGTEARRISRPIDCTQLLKLSPIVSNIITIMWSPDAKLYVMAVNVVKKLSSSTLLQKLIDKGATSSDETKDYIIKHLVDVDPDLATTSYRFSLNCPLGKMRMKFPAKSIHCKHLQCFDASLFILMNEKHPTWLCPTCNQPCLYDDVKIQSYFLEVVSSSSLPDSCQEIEILADGAWRIYEENQEIVENAEDNDRTIDFVTLGESDDENSMDLNKEANLESSNKETKNLTVFDDLTLNDTEEPPKNKDKLKNEGQAADAVQPATTVDLIPQAQEQPQQAVISSEQGVLTEIDCSPSPPATLPPTTTDS